MACDRSQAQPAAVRLSTRWSPHTEGFGAKSSFFYWCLLMPLVRGRHSFGCLIRGFLLTLPHYIESVDFRASVIPVEAGVSDSFMAAVQFTCCRNSGVLFFPLNLVSVQILFVVALSVNTVKSCCGWTYKNRLFCVHWLCSWTSNDMCLHRHDGILN